MQKLRHGVGGLVTSFVIARKGGDLFYFRRQPLITCVNVLYFQMAAMWWRTGHFAVLCWSIGTG